MYSYAQKRQSEQQKQQRTGEKSGGFIPPQITSNSVLNDLASLQTDKAERLTPARSGVSPDLETAMQRRIESIRGFSSPAVKTGIPAQTQQEFEELSGFSFDDVRVHYNSDKPTELGALAYTQGNRVYIGPGQEKHLEHELGHVAQQKAGIVRSTGDIDGVAVNADERLEHGADDLMRIRTVGKAGGKPVVQMKHCDICNSDPCQCQEANAKKGLISKMSDIPKDGNCLYNTVAKVIGDGRKGADLRQAARTWLVNLTLNQATQLMMLVPIESDIDEQDVWQRILAVVATPGQWGGNEGDLAPYILAQALGIRLIIQYPNGDYTVIGEGAGYTIYYNGINHYQDTPFDESEPGKRKFLKKYIEGMKERVEELVHPNSCITLEQIYHSLLGYYPFLGQYKKSDIEKGLIKPILDKKSQSPSEPPSETVKAEGEEKTQIEYGEDGAVIKTHGGLIVVYSNDTLRKFFANNEEGKKKISNLRGAGTSHTKGSKGKATHEHILGGNAVEFTITDKTITITAYGVKSDHAEKGSGGYDWNTRPK